MELVVYLKSLSFIVSPTVGVWKGTRQSTLDKYVPKWASAGAKLIGKFSPLAIPFSAGFIDSDFSMA
jgi:hypothetical protein